MAITPHDWQVEAVEELLQYGHLLVKAPPGSGKTLIGLLAMKFLGSDDVALVITHSRAIKEQWEKHGMSAITIQEFIRDPFDIAADLTILDEVHHYNAPAWRCIYDYILSDYVLGLSATPGAATEHFERTYEVPWEDIELPPYEFFYHRFNLSASEMTEYTQLSHQIANAMSRDLPPDEKEDLILRLSLSRRRLVQESKTRFACLVEMIPALLGEHSLIVCETIAQANALGEALDIPVHHSKSKQKRLLDAFRTGEQPALISVRMLREGFNAPTLDTIIIASSALTDTHMVQVLGRGMRVSGDKEVTFHIFIANQTSDEKLEGLAEGIIDGKNDSEESLEYKWKHGELYSITSNGKIFQAIDGLRQYFDRMGVESKLLKLKRTGGRFRIYNNSEVLTKVGGKIHMVGKVEALIPLPQPDEDAELKLFARTFLL